MTRRQKAIGFFITLCVLLVGAAILGWIYWVVITELTVVRLVVGILLFGVMIAGLIVYTVFLVLEIKRNEEHDTFINSVTHELKTPLASIRLFAEMLDEGRVASDAKRAEYHRLLAGEAERLSTLIENVLDLGRLERGERAFDRRPQRVDEIVRDVVERFRPLAERDGISIETIVADSSNRSAWLADVDRGALAQALLNLLENARKYAREGKRVAVSLETPGAADPAANSGSTRAGTIRVVVRDFGSGVPRSDRELIFDRFRRGERQRDGSVPGLGLGLHVARSLVRAFEGEVDCEEPADGGAGAMFAITLPVASEAAVAFESGSASKRPDRAAAAEIAT